MKEGIAKTSPRMRKQLIDAGVNTEEDFIDEDAVAEPANALTANKPSTIMKQTDQKTYDEMMKKQKALQAEKYLKYKQGGYK
jgi:hypothetical protein